MFWLNYAQAATFMPPAATDVAVMYDKLYSFLVVSSLIAFILVIGGLVFFVLKYKRQSDHDKTAYISHNATLEFLWSFIPFLIFMFVFAWGWILYHNMRTMPQNSLEISVTGEKWAWSFQYKSGRKTSKELFVPVNTPVKLVMTSVDVIHSFYIPAFRIKQDVVPGRYSALWFQANEVGDFDVFCAEYCGDGHSRMLAKVHVMEKDEYEKWLLNDPYKGLSPREIGQKIYTQVCSACHSTGSNVVVGPGFKGLFGKTQKLADGSTVLADENYIRESILNPNAKIALNEKTEQPFPSGVMPTFAGRYSEQEILGIIEYLKTLK